MENERQIIKAHCYQCGGDRNTEILESHCARYDLDSLGTDWSSFEYYIMKCLGCDNIFFGEKRTYSTEQIPIGLHPETNEMIYIDNAELFIWPKSARKRPNWLIELHAVKPFVAMLLDEVYRALDQDSTVLACIGIRTIIDKISEELRVDPNSTFENKLQTLLEKGKISADEKQLLSITIDAGSAAAHRGWRPNERETHQLFDVMESFTHRIFFLGVGFDELQKRIPKRQSKNK